LSNRNRLHCQFNRNRRLLSRLNLEMFTLYHYAMNRGCGSCIVDLPFRITNCRFLLAIVFCTWGLVFINLSFASREFSNLDSHCIRSFVHRRGHHVFCESSFVSLVHGPRWLFMLSRHRKAFLLLLIKSLFVNKDLSIRKSVKRTVKRWEPNVLLRLGNLKCQVVLVGS